MSQSIVTIYNIPGTAILIMCEIYIEIIATGLFVCERKVNCKLILSMVSEMH